MTTVLAAGVLPVARPTAQSGKHNSRQCVRPGSSLQDVETKHKEGPLQWISGNRLLMVGCGGHLVPTTQ